MKNDFSKWGFSAIALITCLLGIITLTGAGICLAAEEEEVEESEETEKPVLDSRFTDEIGWLEKKADNEAQEVNDTINKEIRLAELRKKVRYREELGYVPKGKLLSDEELSVFEMERKQKLEAIRREFSSDINNVEVLGIAALQIETATQPEIKPNVKVVFGTVTGIVLYDRKGAALVADRVVRANDVIRGNKVIRVLPDYVEFEKQGKKWVQEVGQPPPTNVWEEKNKK